MIRDDLAADDRCEVATPMPETKLELETERRKRTSKHEQNRKITCLLRQYVY